MDLIWDSMNIASRISKQIENTDKLVPKSQQAFVTPLADLQELITTINCVRTTLVPFVTTSGRKGKVVADPSFETCILGIKHTLSELLQYFKELEKDFPVNTWKTQKVKLYQMDFLVKQKLDQFAALFAPEETKDINSTSPSSPPNSLHASPKRDVKSNNATYPLTGAHMISDDEGKDLWIKSFGDATLMVPWAVFFNTMESFFSTSLKADEEVIKSILNFTKTDQVSPYEFSVFLKWFGPLHGCFQRMLDAVKGGLLCGFVPAVEANLLLEGRKEGTFLIRCSKTQPGSFAVTFVDNALKVKHCLLYSVHPHGLTLKNPPTVYGSLVEFAEAHTNKLKHPLGNKWTQKMKLTQFPYGQPMEGNLTTSPTPSNNNTNNNNTLTSKPGKDDMSDANMCIVCMDAPMETVFLECGHLACCHKCAEKLKLCPICRNAITRIIPIFRAT